MKLPKQVKKIFLNNNCRLIANNQGNLIVTFSAKIDEQEEALITVNDGQVVLILGNCGREIYTMEKMVIDRTMVIGYEPIT